MTRSPSILADCIGQLAWLAQSTHQAHHQDSGVAWRECPRSTCQSAASFCARLERVLREELEPIQSTSHATVEQLVTETKLRGSSLSLWGHTKPERWPYRVLVAVGSPGNEAVLEMAAMLERAIKNSSEHAVLVHVSEGTP